jgi:hypothetical protein
MTTTVKQISDGNPDGCCFGQSITDKVSLFGQTPVAQPTGYGTPTGNAVQASFAAGSITLSNLAAEVAQLVVDLKKVGIIGA